MDEVRYDPNEVIENWESEDWIITDEMVVCWHKPIPQVVVKFYNQGENPQ